jgi:hypothetical protein
LILAFRLSWRWLLVIGWSALHILIAQQLDRRERGPIDFLTYRIAAEKVARGERVHHLLARCISAVNDDRWKTPAR